MMKISISFVMRVVNLLLVVLGISISTLAYGHEFWIEAKDWQLQPGEDIRLSLRVGTDFKGLEQIYFPQKINRFDWVTPKASAPFKGRLGDMPAGVMRPETEGLYIIRHETMPDRVDYETLDQFERFAAKKGYPEAVARHRERQLPASGFREIYRRFAKALVAVGDGQGNDQRLGMEVEITALNNPFHLSDRMLKLQLHRDGKPWSGARVTVFARVLDAGDGAAEVAVQQTDADDKGLVTLEIRPGFVYLIDAVSLEEINPDHNQDAAVWSSRWASLTFAVPLP